MPIPSMHISQLRQADLNLLVVFAVLAEERHVSRAAKRLGLTQPAVSRALQRTREMFHDDLLVRTGGTYQPTPMGHRLLGELEAMLPRLDSLMSGTGFDPTREDISFRIVATDYAALLCGERLSSGFTQAGNKVSFEFVQKVENMYDALDRGQVDLVLSVDDGNKGAAKLASEFLWDEQFVCVVAEEQPYSKQLTLRQYMSFRHVQVTGAQSLVERCLSIAGEKRAFAFTSPYFTVAIRAVRGTDFVATVGRRMAEYEAKRPGLKILKAPKEIIPYRYMMFWHPRMNTDGAHVWLRDAMKAIGDSINAS